jgi:excisionase family DNA binding protein
VTGGPLRSLPHDFPVARGTRPDPGHPEGLRPKPGRPRRSWMTVDEVAAELRISKMTVTRLVHAGEIPHRRFGRSIRIDEAAFDRWAYGTETVLEDET